jgi:hypothetical protein
MPVAMMFTGWLIVWMCVGAVVGSLFGSLGTGITNGFIFAVVSIFSWPWIMPTIINEWMSEGYVGWPITD